MIILLGSEKGGSGKTTMAVNLAAIRAGQGREVLIIDADKQGSASQWAAVRLQDSIEPAITCVGIYGETLAEQVRALADKYDDIVIDTRGSDAAELRSAMLVADRLITPARTSQFDVYTLSSMDRLVQQARGFNPDLDAAILINSAPTNAMSSEARDMAEMVEDLQNYRLLRMIIKDRKAFRRCARDGNSVVEDGMDEKAIYEMNRLAREVWS